MLRKVILLRSNLSNVLVEIIVIKYFTRSMGFTVRRVKAPPHDAQRRPTHHGGVTVATLELDVSQRNKCLGEWEKITKK